MSNEPFEFSSKSIELKTDQPLEEALSLLDTNAKIGFILFYDPECGACMAYRPDYNQLVDEINSDHVFFHLHLPDHVSVDKDQRWTNPGTIPRLFQISRGKPPVQIDRDPANVRQIWQKVSASQAITADEDTSSRWSRYINQAASDDHDLDQGMLQLSFAKMGKIVMLKEGLLVLPYPS